MEKFTVYTGLAAPLDVANVDTDQIVPKQFLKRVERTGFGKFLFFNQRFNPDGSPRDTFILNQSRYRGAGVLLARENFGSGSSREHAPWALMDYGFRVIIAPSFADIFRNNAFNNGLLLIQQDQDFMNEWFKRAAEQPGYTITVDLPAQTVTGKDGFAAFFQIDPFHKRRLVEGLDNIGLTLQELPAIEAYEKAHSRPWQAAVSTPEEAR